MSVVSVEARSFILALFIRDDGERFLLGDNGYDFIDSQLHFTANAIENDEVQKQGTDGVLVAGQVRRASVQTFDGYIGDATTPKSKIEQMRRDFFAFFAKGHHFRVIYVDCNRDAWQRKGGYLVDAPEVKELWQIHPEYHVGLNFEDVNYYEYDENAEGEEILANVLSVPISSEIEGGLEWDEDGAISVLPYGNPKTATGKSISVSDAVQAPLKSLEIQGETSQQTYSGKNKLNTFAFAGQGVQATVAVSSDGTVTLTGNQQSNGWCSIDKNGQKLSTFAPNLVVGTTYYLYLEGENMARTNMYLTSSAFAWYAGTAHTITAQDLNSSVVFYGGYNTTSTFKVMITATSDNVYEQYVGGTASPNPDYPQAVQTVAGENVVKISDGQGNEQSYTVNLGKNLFDPAIAAHPSGMPNNLGETLRVDTNTTYTFNVGNDRNFAQVQLFDNTGTRTRTLGNGVNDHTLTFTTTAIEVSGLFCFYPGQAGVDPTTYDYTGVQFEKGSQATSYAAYFTPIELCKIGVHQDYIYKSGGKWYVHKEVGKHLFNGSETFTSDGSYNSIYQYKWTDSSVFSTTDQTGVYAMSDRFMGTYYNSSWTKDFAVIVRTTHNALRFMTSLSSTISAFQTWLAANPTTVYYPLATPTDTEIINETLVAQLEVILSQGKTYAGTNNITTVIAAGNEQGELEVEYYSGYQDGGYVWEEGGSGGPTTVVNESISAVYPVWTVYGPAQNPILENTTNNTSIEYVGMVADGQTLVIDMGAQTASLDGLNVLSALTGDFIQLEAGSNILLYSASNDAPASEIGWSEIVG